MKVYGTFSGRRTSSELRVCQDKGFVRKAPHYNTISKYLNETQLTQILLELIRESTRPLKGVESDFAADSTGVSTFQISRWYDEKFGAKARLREWLKLHICVGVDTHIVTDVKISEPDSHDTNYFKPLIKGTSRVFKIKEISADKAYLSRTNLKVAQDLGAQVFIPPKKNSTGGSSKILKDHITFARNNLVEFNEHYHKRSNVESAIQMIKSKFSEGVRSKNRTAKVNETLCKILCHNLAVLVRYETENGIEANFWSDVA
jgi:transposase